MCSPIRAVAFRDQARKLMEYPRHHCGHNAQTSSSPVYHTLPCASLHLLPHPCPRNVPRTLAADMPVAGPHTGVRLSRPCLLHVHGAARHSDTIQHKAAIQQISRGSNGASTDAKHRDGSAPCQRCAPSGWRHRDICAVRLEVIAHRKCTVRSWNTAVQTGERRCEHRRDLETLEAR